MVKNIIQNINTFIFMLGKEITSMRIEKFAKYQNPVAYSHILNTFQLPSVYKS